MNKQSGFTLIELMVVTGIIGILVTIVIPAYRHYQAKANQSEAKLALAGIFSLEKSFYAEYSAYAPSFDAIGFISEGNRRYYAVGWTGGSYAGTITGYPGSLTMGGYSRYNVPSTYLLSGCTAAVASTYLPDRTITPWSVSDPQAMNVGASGNVQANGICDVWQIDDLKTLKNTQIGI